QCEKTQDKRADEDVAHDPPLAKDQPRNKAQAEGPIFVGDVIVPLNEDHLAGPNIFKADAIDDEKRVIVRVRILQYEPNRVVLTLKPQQNHAAAVLEAHDHGQGPIQMRKPAPIQMDGLALKSDGLCTSKDLSDRNFTVRQDVVVGELRHRQVKPMVL